MGLYLLREPEAKKHETLTEKSTGGTIISLRSMSFKDYSLPERLKDVWDEINLDKEYDP